jgi:hypothetical protein
MRQTNCLGIPLLSGSIIITKSESCTNEVSKLIQISENIPSVHKCIVFQIIKFDSKTEYVESEW